MRLKLDSPNSYFSLKKLDTKLHMHSVYNMFLSKDTLKNDGVREGQDHCTTSHWI